MYKALHPSLTIRQSDIHGLGIFATKNIPANTILGISHVEQFKYHRYHCGYIRTPLGGFINHSDDDPNCIKIKINDDGSCSSLEGIVTSETMAMETIRDIFENEELTVSYTIYSLEKGE
jgi:SET domain-containing protein